MTGDRNDETRLVWSLPECIAANVIRALGVLRSGGRRPARAGSGGARVHLREGGGEMG